jgi:DNA-binding MarR family transcriptional regulator
MADARDIAERGQGGPDIRSIAALSESRDGGPVLLTRLFVAIDALFSQLRRVASLGPNERVAVEVLWEFGAMPMSELADRIAVTRAAVTTLVDRLEHTGLLVRDGDIRDRRRTIVQLSDSGRDVCAQSTRPWLDALRDVFDELPDETWAQVGPLLGRLYEATRAECDRERGITDAAS